MCLKKYNVSCLDINILIFGSCVLTISIQGVVDILNHRLDNSYHQIIYCIILIVISSFLVFCSVFSITKKDYSLANSNDIP